MAKLRIMGYLSESVWELTTDEGYIFIIVETRLQVQVRYRHLCHYIVVMSAFLVYMFSSKLLLFKRDDTIFCYNHRGSSIDKSVEIGDVSTDKDGNFFRCYI